MIQNRYEYWFKQSFLNSKQIKDINKYIKKILMVMNNQ